MLRIPKKVYLYRTLFLLLFLATLVWLGTVVSRDLETIAGSLRQLGWADYLGISEGTWPLLKACFGNALCQAAFNGLWAETFAMWQALVPGAALLAIALSYTMIKKPPEKSPGLARWAHYGDIQKLLFPRCKRLLGFYGTPLDTHGKPLAKRQIVAVADKERFRHTIVFGGTGAGKTSGYFLPNLLLDARARIASVVFDLKYPDDSGLLQAVDFYRAADRPVFRFTPFEPSAIKLNPLEGIETYNDALKVAGLIVPHEAEAQSGSFYRNLEREILAGLALGVSRDGDPSLSKILQLTQSGRQGLLAYVKTRPYLKPYFHNIFDVRADTLAGTLEGIATSHLQIFHNPALAQTLAAGPDAVSLKGEAFRGLLRDGGLFYIGIPQEELVSGGAQVLLRLLKRLLDNAILSIANQEGASLPTPLSVYLDEFPNFGVLPAISENLATLRSRRVALHIGMQSKAQGEDVYGFSGFKAVVSNNFAQVVLFPGSLRLEENTYWSKVLGETSVLEWNRAKSRQHFFERERTTWSAREVPRPLLSAEEMHTFPQGEGVVTLSNCPPVRVSLTPLGRKDHPLYTSWRDHLLKGRRLGKLELETEGERRAADPPVPDKTVPRPVRPPSLGSWLAEQVQAGTALKGHWRQGELTRVDVAVHETDLNAAQLRWLQEVWVKRHGEGLKLTPKGLGTLSLKETRWLKRTCNLLAWFDKHQDDGTPVLIEQGALFLPKEALAELGLTVDELGTEVDKTVGGSARRLVRIPLGFSRKEVAADEEARPPAAHAA